ncbi:MAG: DUF6502 family protein [Proteobacteria bacterium]|nr:DUF6502 family protein [Pseudomonadota bacterium]
MSLTKLNKLLSYLAYRVFRPLVVLFLRNSIPFQTASGWLKRIYVDTAFDNVEFRIQAEKKQTKTRVAVLTGLSRVEIDRVLKIDKPIEVTEQTWNRSTKVLSAWSNDKAYLDDHNKASQLPIYGKSSFSSLVEKYSGGATMRSVLDDLVQVKSVAIENDYVRLLRTSYVEKPDKQKLFNLEIYGLSTGDLLNTLTYNDSVVEKDQARYQKLVFEDQIPNDSIKEMKQFIQLKTDELLVTIDAELSRLNVNKNINTKTSRVGLGAYYFEEKNYEKTNEK